MIGYGRPCLVGLWLEVRFMLTGQSYGYAIRGVWNGRVCRPCLVGLGLDVRFRLAG